MPAASAGTRPAATAPASLFGAPGITRPLEQKENNDNAVTALSQANATQALGYIPLRQTDVIYGWQLQLTHAVTPTAGTGAITVSPYFPDNFLGTTQLNMQNQFSTINVESGIDLALFQAIRPMRKSDRRNGLYTTTTNLYNPATDIVSLSNYTNASTSILRRYEFPAGMWFDQYFELDAAGNALTSAPLRAFVSPQYMAGTARIVTPILNFNPLAGSKADQGPYTVTGNATLADSVTQNWRRIGIYQPMGAEDSPPVFNWQYVRRTQRFSLSGVSSANLLVPLNGQILSVYVRMFDPSSGGVGAPIAISAVSECDVQYGSGLYRYQDTPTDTMARFIAQHGSTLLTTGLLAWDFALDDQDNLTNRYALNTMNTSGIQVSLTFTGAQSSTAYAVVGVEALQYVEL